MFFCQKEVDLELARMGHLKLALEHAFCWSESSIRISRDSSDSKEPQDYRRQAESDQFLDVILENVETVEILEILSVRRPL